jgi:hypothetical protein
MSEDRIVVVGVDGSAGSLVALRWALDHADQLGAIEPVMTFVNGPLERSTHRGGGSRTGQASPTAPLRSSACTTFSRRPHPHCSTPGWSSSSGAGPGLVKAARSAELLVVGTQGVERSSSISPIGSVGAYCVRHATVPIALIPARRTAGPRPSRRRCRRRRLDALLERSALGAHPCAPIVPSHRRAGVHRRPGDR